MLGVLPIYASMGVNPFNELCVDVGGVVSWFSLQVVNKLRSAQVLLLPLLRGE